MKKIIYLFLLLVLAATARAEGVAQMLDIDFVRVDRNGLGLVRFISDLTNTPPSCTQTAYTRSMAFDTNTAGGRSILSVVLAAKASGKKVYARGTGSCDVYGVMEDWGWGYIQ